MTRASANMLADIVGRLRSREPLRLLVGGRLHAASEIALTTAFETRLRDQLVVELETSLAEFTGLRPEDPVAPATPAPAERSA